MVVPRIIIVDPYQSDTIRRMHEILLGEKKLVEGTDYSYFTSSEEAIQYIQSCDPRQLHRIAIHYRSNPPAEREQIGIIKSIQELQKKAKRLNPDVVLVGFDYDAPDCTVEELRRRVYEGLGLE